MRHVYIQMYKKQRKKGSLFPRPFTPTGALQENYGYTIKTFTKRAGTVVHAEGQR